MMKQGYLLSSYVQVSGSPLYFSTAPVRNLCFLTFQCLTARGRNELARVSIVNEQNEVVYDELVKPYSRIVNYLTR